MARAERVPGPVKLTLSEEEAEALIAVLSKVGGSRVDSGRRHTDAIAQALREAGIPQFPIRYNISGTVTFEN